MAKDPFDGNHARLVLGVIRLVNGAAALFAPARLARLLGVDPESSPAALYVLRLFGIRTLILGGQLLVLKGDQLEGALRLGVLIHAADVTAALMAGLRGQLPRRAAFAGTVISTANAALALKALRALERSQAQGGQARSLA